MPQIWSSFNTVQRRIQNGGWARQVTQADFAISTTISGVNMRLTAGCIRELHWHQAAEWAYMTYGYCRITVIDPTGRPPTLPTSRRAISGIFLPDIRIRCRVWDRTVANLSSASMTARRASSTHCW
jgi:hypothetical protein